MTAFIRNSFLRAVDLHTETNNTEHRTSEISQDQLIVRRGQPFTLTLHLTQPFNSDPLTIVAATGKHPSEDRGTKSCFGIPDTVRRSPSAKAVWKVELHGNSAPLRGILTLTLTPPADAPIGKYDLSVTLGDVETSVAKLVVLFNPWCPDDWVYLSDERERQEYVMSEQGIIFRGSGNYIVSLNWDFGQFEDNMVDICMKILDVNRKHLKDPADDVSARCNPIYVSRVVSAMINSQDDRGVLVGNWGNSFRGGVPPTQWSGSHAILRRWYLANGYPVKYGQCWVFAGVMCSVMRLLGIPCRVVTNYQSAHDNNKNLTIDIYHADYGVREKKSKDSVWNYHVWVEGWMRRPDLAQDGKYDGWQALDPTPQEKSDGVYCCGPAPVTAILNGDTHLKYDVPFVYAEVNADCIDWMIRADGSKMCIYSDTNRVGQNISTKSIGSNKRLNITDTYKHREGSDKERAVFRYAITRDFSRDEDIVWNGGGEANHEPDEPSEERQEVTPPPPPTPDDPLPHVSMQFKEESQPMNGKDVSLRLVLSSDSSVARRLSISIGVQAMRYNGSPAANIQSEAREETLQPGSDLSVPVLIPFSAYHKHMVQCDSMKVSAVVTDQREPDKAYLAVDDVVLKDPPISMTVSSYVRLHREGSGEVIFMNPLNETLTDCTVTLTGSGLLREEAKFVLPDLRPSNRIRMNFFFVPYKIGEKTLVADFDCSAFRDVKASCTFTVIP